MTDNQDKITITFRGKTTEYLLPHNASVSVRNTSTNRGVANIVSTRITVAFYTESLIPFTKEMYEQIAMEMYESTEE